MLGDALILKIFQLAMLGFKHIRCPVRLQVLYLVTIKRGKKGKAQIYSGSVSRPTTRRSAPQNNREWLDMFYEAQYTMLSLKSQFQIDCR